MNRPRKLPRSNSKLKQAEFFFCDVFDAVPKGDMASMEHPIFALSTTPDDTIREYENNGVRIQVIPSVLGMATVHDRDILIYCFSQVMAALNRGRDVSRVVRFRAKDMLLATNRSVAGSDYERLKASLNRIAGVRITTNIVTGGEEITTNFGLVESTEIVRKTAFGRMQEIEIVLSTWLFNALTHNEVLTINRDYFKLRKPLERRLYEIARKHCGGQGSWKIGVELLRDKCGSTASLLEFRRLVKRIAKADEKDGHIPDYSITFSPDGDLVHFKNKRVTQAPKEKPVVTVPQLDPNIYDAIRALVPGCDVYALEQEWRAWTKTVPRDPEMAFLGFCRKRAEG